MRLEPKGQFEFRGAGSHVFQCFFQGPQWFPKCLNGGFRGVFVLKSGLRILIRTPEVPFLVPPKTPKMGVFGYFGGTENGTSGARIKILRPLFNTNTPPKTPI